MNEHKARTRGWWGQKEKFPSQHPHVLTTGDADAVLVLLSSVYDEHLWSANSKYCSEAFSLIGVHQFSTGSTRAGRAAETPNSTHCKRSELDKTSATLYLQVPERTRWRLVPHSCRHEVQRVHHPDRSCSALRARVVPDLQATT